MALRARAPSAQTSSAQAPSVQAPARRTAGGATIRTQRPPSTQRTQAAGAAAPSVAARPPRRRATVAAATGPYPAKKSPTGACDEAWPFRSVFVTTCARRMRSRRA